MNFQRKTNSRPLHLIRLSLSCLAPHLPLTHFQWHSTAHLALDSMRRHWHDFIIKVVTYGNSASKEKPSKFVRSRLDLGDVIAPALLTPLPMSMCRWHCLRPMSMSLPKLLKRRKVCAASKVVSVNKLVAWQVPAVSRRIACKQAKPASGKTAVSTYRPAATIDS